MIVLYGIKNCDTVKKARRWLTEHRIDYRFHDFRADGLEQAQAENWLQALGPDLLLNKRSTTWKQLSDQEKSQLLSGGVSPAARLIVDKPTLIKRPLLVSPDTINTGFKAAEYAALFNCD